MKLLVAIEASKPKNIVDTSLRWCGRLGFDLRVFYKHAKQRGKYQQAIGDANYHWYLALEDSQLVSRTDPMTYAWLHDYDIVVIIPEHLMEWRKNTRFKAEEIKYAYEAIASARGEFSRKPRKRIKRFANGTVMRRI